MSLPAYGPKPSWLKIKLATGRTYNKVRKLAEGLDLHTICTEGHCPNIYECWSQGTATFMILGDVCTRRCGFCNVKTGLPSAPPDEDEARRVAEAVAHLGLKHAVITSVDRDDLSDGGASVFASTVEAIRIAAPNCAVEVLTPDFKQDQDRALNVVLEARPEIFSHNIETVPSLYRTARPGSRFETSVGLLRAASSRKSEFEGHTKTAMMLGLGEKAAEIEETMQRVVDAGVDVLTLGQYLRPTPSHLPVARYVEPEEFERWRCRGLEMGFGHVESGPLVRSSYHAQEHRPGEPAR